MGSEQFSYFPGSIKQTKSAITMPLAKVKDLIQGEALAKATAAIREEQDASRQKELKEKLPYVIFNGRYSERSNAGLLEHSGLDVDDFDHVADLTQKVEALERDPHTLLLWISPRGQGIKVVTRGPADPPSHEQRFYDRRKYYQVNFDLETDDKMKALSQATFLCHDPDVFFNPDAQPFSSSMPAPSESEGTAATVTNDTGVDQLRSSALEALIKDMDPVDQGDKYEVRCPKCNRHEAFVFKCGDSRIRCAHKNSCGFISEPLIASENFHLSDDGNAQRFIQLHGSELLFCNGRRRRWYCWDGVRFQEDRTGRVHFMARDVPAHIKAEADALPHIEGTQDRRKKLFAYSISSENASKLKALVERAAVDPRVAVTPEQLDRDPWRLCVRNGYVNLRTGELEPPDPERLITRQAAVTFDSKAACPKWDAMIDKVTCGRKDLALFLQLLCGYVLTGETYEDKFFLFIGDGANGKSTLLETIGAILGDYAVTPPQGTFLERKFHNPSSASPELALLQGARLATMSETDKGDRVALGLLKRLAAGGKGMARDMYAGLEADTPTVKIVIDSNHAPQITGSDFGTWRRVCRIPFDHRFNGNDLIPDFRVKMVRDEYGEHSGILNWMLRGCLLWKEAGRLEMPGEVETATEAYRCAEDPVTRFLDECTTPGEGFAASAGGLYKMFREWRDLNGERVEMSSVRFSDEMKTRGYKKIRTNRGQSYRGLALNETSDYVAEEQGTMEKSKEI